MQTYNLLIVEDHALIRFGLKTAFETKDFINTIFEAVNAEETIEIVKKQKLSEITLKEFISKLEAERKRRNDIMKKRLPKGVQIESSTSTNHSIELKYEWEKK